MAGETFLKNPPPHVVGDESCSPYRVPVARLAAAQAAIEEKCKAKKK